MESLTVRIEKALESKGYMYYIEIDGNEVDGGQCTTTIENALDMATSQATDCINRLNKQN
jgi:hypothetical protein